MARKPQEAALATRNLILGTTECVFQRRGVSRTSLHEIGSPPRGSPGRSIAPSPPVSRRAAHTP
ncbi:MAG: hypothetical protein H7274_00995 [Rhodoferax sp.]|nr:hypothetical protein [Rhodoferax sp.]